MTVGELIEKLQAFDLNAEAHYAVSDDWNGSTEIHEVYESTAQYGVALNPIPPRVKTVVMASGVEGM